MRGRMKRTWLCFTNRLLDYNGTLGIITGAVARAARVAGPVSTVPAVLAYVVCVMSFAITLQRGPVAHW